MSHITIAPYGTWHSPITAATVASQGLRLGFVSIDRDDVYWLEGRPAEGGRNVLVRRAADGAISDVTPPDANVRSRVHEYGGGAYLVADGTAYYSNFADQRVYALRVDGGEPHAITPPGPFFYADYAFDRRRQRLICVREDHSGAGEPQNTLVAIAAGGDDAHMGLTPAVIAAGYDFYSTPRLNAEGTALCWLAWRHPNMPWDGTELWVADLDDGGMPRNHRLMAGGPEESIYQPGWSPDGDLYYVSDRSGYWQIYRVTADDGHEQVTTDPEVQQAEFGGPQWQFGTASWAFVERTRMVVRHTQAGRWEIAELDLESGKVATVSADIQPGEWLAARGSTVAFVGASTTMPSSVVLLEARSPQLRVLRSSSSLAIDAGYLSAAETIEFPTAGERHAHAFYYPPRNKDYRPPEGERPPVVVISHGGPTTAARATLDLQIQFWTSRGFAVVDVNYGGSSGYGRPYRERLHGQWGIVDVQDCVHAALFLAGVTGQGAAGDESQSRHARVDRQRLAIRGGSAGGYTTLAALTFHPGVFRAGASYYGVSDIEMLARDTHKFESRYLDTLVGPYPAARDRYRARSPIHFIDRLACPLILLQGLDDKVVPPNQAQMMADAVRAKGLPVALLMFEGEQHGFRRAETMIRSLEAELYFYGVVFGFTPADRIEPIEIANA